MPAADLFPYLRDVPDFPQPGIMFKDITPLLRDPAGLAMAVELMASPFRGKGVDLVCGAESRGFIFGTAIAQSLSAGFVPIRKPNKLPFAKHSVEYGLEYGTDTLAAHTDALGAGNRVLVVDDVLATGGTARAACDLVGQLGGELVGASFLLELGFLGGRERLMDIPLTSLLVID